MLLNKIKNIFVSRLFLLYLLFGGIATVVDWSTYYLFLVSFNLHYSISVTFAFILGSITNFSLNKRFNFNNKYKKVHNQFLLYLLIAFGGLILTITLMWLLIDVCIIDPFLSRVIATAITLIYNFLGHKYVTFNILK
jgi:putative flippase GtrA